MVYDTGLFTKFFGWNRKLCIAIERALPASFTRHLHTSYKYLVAEKLNSSEGLTVVDIGGGKQCPYLPFVAAPERHSIIGLDISEDELRKNRSLTLKVVADTASAALPLATGSIDLLTSRSVIEHLRDNRAFMHSCFHILRAGSCMIHVFPGRFAPFALINAFLPDRLARTALLFSARLPRRMRL